MMLKMKLLSDVCIENQGYDDLFYKLSLTKRVREDTSKLEDIVSKKISELEFLKEVDLKSIGEQILASNKLNLDPLYSVEPNEIEEELFTIGRVKITIKDPNLSVYIPGSTIKGAICSSLIYDQLFNKKIKCWADYENIINLVEKKICKYISVSDAYGTDNLVSLRFSMLRSKGKNKRSSPLFVETIKKGSILQFSVDILRKKELSQLLDFSSENIVSEILDKIKRYYVDAYSIEKELAFPAYDLNVGNATSFLRIGCCKPFYYMQPLVVWSYYNYRDFLRLRVDKKHREQYKHYKQYKEAIIKLKKRKHPVSKLIKVNNNFLPLGFVEIEVR